MAFDVFYWPKLIRSICKLVLKAMMGGFLVWSPPPWPCHGRNHHNCFTWRVMRRGRWMRWWRTLKVTHASCKATGLVTYKIFFFFEYSKLICFRGTAEISLYSTIFLSLEFRSSGHWLVYERQIHDNLKRQKEKIASMVVFRPGARPSRPPLLLLVLLLLYVL